MDAETTTRCTVEYYFNVKKEPILKEVSITANINGIFVDNELVETKFSAGCLKFIKIGKRGKRQIFVANGSLENDKPKLNPTWLYLNIKPFLKEKK